MKRSVAPFLVFFLLFLIHPASGQKTVPELWGTRIHDDAKVLSAPAVDQLEQKLKAYEDSTSNQIAVLVISSLDGEAIEDYSIKVVEKWKLGQQKKDNGVLLLIVVDDHKVRIEVGKGLEDQLTDAQCSRIIRNEIAPDFRKNNYDAGVADGVDAIIKIIAGEYTAEPSTSEGDSLFVRIVEAFFIFGLLFVFSWQALFTRGCSGWGLYFVLLFCYAIFPWIFIGQLAAKILFGIFSVGGFIAKLVLPKTRWGKKQIKNWENTKSSGGGGSRGGGFFGGGIIGGGLSALGGSVFSGGGGGFGGGGSSGSW